MVELSSPDYWYYDQDRDPYNRPRNLRRDVWPFFPQIVDLERNFRAEQARYKKKLLIQKGLLPDEPDLTITNPNSVKRRARDRVN